MKIWEARARRRLKGLAMAGLLVACFCVSLPCQAGEFWDLPPLRYSESEAKDRFARLMVLDHQARLYSLLTKASMHYRRALWLEKALAKQGGGEPCGKNMQSARIAKGRGEKYAT